MFLLGIFTKICGWSQILVILFEFVAASFFDFSHHLFCQKYGDSAKIFYEKILRILMKIKDYLKQIFGC
jgi:hypothetical protein